MSDSGKELVLSKPAIIALEGASLVGLIIRWWTGVLTTPQLLKEIANMCSRIYDRFFGVSKELALKNAYKELSLPQGTKDRSEITKRYNQLVLIHHPDKGGDKDKFDEITVARDTILASLSG
ncbi:uncharacterized protein LOC142336885 [Convolutriloba macropyga]|uniref:uncharacterized protein LOC142336885 n=1 Tax=Convolutriloba macropyga TaxID=536237 RepID=UPI003F527FAF